MRIGLQYTLWNKFDGATNNFDGAGRNAHNNNTIFAYAWNVLIRAAKSYFDFK